MRSLLTIICLTAICLVSQAQDLRLLIPQKVIGRPNTFIRIEANTTGKAVQWYSVTPGLAVFPPDLLKDNKTAVVIGPAGTYRLIAWTAIDGLPTPPVECVVIISDDPSPEPGPGPQPGPANDYERAIESAWKTDGSNKEKAGILRDCYIAGKDLIASKSITLVKDFDASMRTLVQKYLGPDDLPTVRRTIANRLNERLSRDINARFDESARAAAGSVFEETIAALKRL